MLTSDLWRVRVFTEDGRTETYWFNQKVDVIASIQLTWGKCTDRVAVAVFGNRIEVTELGDQRIALIAEPFDVSWVLQGPTHF